MIGTVERINLVPFPKNVALSNPDWSFDSLLSELTVYEKTPTYILKVSDKTAAREVSQPKSRRFPKANEKDGVLKAFAVHDSVEECKIDDEKPPVAGWRLDFGELFLSDSEDSEDHQNKLMSPVGFVEATLSETTKDRRLSNTDEMRSQKMELETSLMIEYENYAFDLAHTKKQAEAKLEAVKRYDLQYQREVAGALDTRMVALQRDREHKSQIEERRIRDDKAREEAQKRERASREEKLRQEKIEAEAQARLEAGQRAEAATLEAERREAEATSASQDKKNAESTKNPIKGAETALNLEAQRLKIYEELSAKNKELRKRSNLDITTHERTMKRTIRTISGVEDNVSDRAHNLGLLINQPNFPKSISIMMFVDAIVAQCEKPTFNRSTYAYAKCAVMVSSEVPIVMDILVAKLNQVCIYTVPKHISHSKSAFESKDAYHKAIGFQQEDDGKNECAESFLGRMASYMKLYGAIVQTEVQGVQNPHGLEQGWLWLSRFLNSLPANLYTATALNSFIEMAGYAMHRRFGRQFVKLVGIISRDFVDALPEEKKSTTTKTNLRDYLKSKKYLNEPEEREKRVNPLSRNPEFRI